MIVAAAITPGTMIYEGHVVAENPFGIGLPDKLIDVLTAVGGVVLLCGLAGSVVSLILRYRHSHGLERQQMKWFAVAAALVAIAPVWFVLAEVPTIAAVRGLVNLQYVLLTGSLTAVPVAIGVAILRHNLYDIDRIINRALVFSALTATLLTLYLAIVLGLSQLVRAVSGESSQLVIAASTLIVAAAFRPLRGRIQSNVDQRFYRRQYDANRTIELFTTRMRDVVDVATIEEALVSTVFATIQPAHVSLWLRTSAAYRTGPHDAGRVNENRVSPSRLPAAPTRPG
jgi:hypothetical protein